MFGLLILFWSAFADDKLQIVGAALPEGQYFDCPTLNPPNNPTAVQLGQAQENCVNAGWCVWVVAGDNANTCVRDQCLKAISSTNPSVTDCPASTQNCGLYYITDVHDCGTKANPGSGSQTSYEDVYCRINQTGYLTKAIDKCFYDDLKSRPGAGTCGNKPCAWGGGSSTTDSPGRFCRATDAQICTDVIGDLGAFCDCLGSTNDGKFCNLHPNCILNDQKLCVEDLCTRATAGLSATSCQNVPASQNPSECGGRYERRIDPTTGELSANAELKCANIAKNKDGNTCFWGIDSKVETWATPQNPNPDAADGKWPDCRSVTAVNKCTSLGVYNYSSGFSGTLVADTFCEVATIPTGYFAGTEICINPGREVPTVVGAGTRLKVPSLLAVLLVMVALAGYAL